MAAYYNEFEPYAAEWLRNLIKKGLIADGEVDERSIVDVSPEDLRGFTQCHFFAGIAGGPLALRLAGWPDERPVWTGSCPCQPFSIGGDGKGFEDERHLWPEFHRLIAECRPPVIFGEQVASKAGLVWLDAVFADLEGSGYAAGAVDCCAAGVGAPHIRQRLWFVAHRLANAHDTRLEGWGGTIGCEVRADGQAAARGSCGGDGAPSQANGCWRDADWLLCRDGGWRPVEPGTRPLAHGISGRVGRLRAYGNAVVPQVAAEVIGAYMEIV